MAEILKQVGETATEEFIGSLVGKYVHVPTNKQLVQGENGKEEIVNGWFAGQVAGYEKAAIGFDFPQSQFLETPLVLFSVILTDGASYMLEPVQSAIVELTNEEFTELIAEHDAIASLKDTATELIVPERKIILPDEVK
jgi:hypothetical protein